MLQLNCLFHVFQLLHSGDGYSVLVVHVFVLLDIRQVQDFLARVTLDGHQLAPHGGLEVADQSDLYFGDDEDLEFFASEVNLNFDRSSVIDV